MIINTTSGYKRDYKKLVNKHKIDEINRIENISSLFIKKNNMQEVLNDPFSKVYGIDKKCEDLKNIYTAKLNSKMRLWIEPNGEYPYVLKNINIVSYIKIDDKHYGEG